MYDSIATLKEQTTSGFDSYGNPIRTTTERMVYVQPRSVYQSEFYNAAQLGLKPSLSLHLTNRADYSGEKLLEFEGREYIVIRADWTGQRDGITLVCEERVSNG